MFLILMFQLTDGFDALFYGFLIDTQVFPDAFVAFAIKQTTYFLSTSDKLSRVFTMLKTQTQRILIIHRIF